MKNPFLQRTKTSSGKTAIAVFFVLCVALNAPAQVYIDEQFDYADGPLTSSGSPWTVTWGGSGTQGTTILDIEPASGFSGYTPTGKQLLVDRSSTTTGGAPMLNLSTAPASAVTSPWNITQGDNVNLTFDLFVGSFTSGANAEYALRGGSTGSATFFGLRALGTSTSDGKFQVRTTGAAASYTDLLVSGSPVTLAEDTWFRVNYSSTIGRTDAAGTNGRQFYNLSIEQLGTGGSMVFSGTNLILDPTATIGGTGLFSLNTGGAISYSVADVYLVPEPSTYALLALAAVGVAAHRIRRRRSSPR